jgi:hypothetical protein
MRYHVEFEVTPEHLGEVLTTLAGKVEHLRVNERQEAAHRKPKRTDKAANTRTGKLILESINGRGRSLEELGQVLAENNLSPKSASPACGKLVEEGLLKRVERGMYAKV